MKLIVWLLWGILAVIVLARTTGPCFNCDEDKRKCVKCLYYETRKKHSKFQPKKGKVDVIADEINQLTKEEWDELIPKIKERSV